MKPKLMVHRSHARTVSSLAEQERLLAQGWVLAQAKPRTKMAKRMRDLRERRRAAGWKAVTLWFSAGDVAAVAAAQRPGETLAELIIRLVRKQSLL